MSKKGSIKFVARAAISNADYDVLLRKEAGEAHHTLPSADVEYGEYSFEALERALADELQNVGAVEVGPLITAGERTPEEDPEDNTHEVYFVFETRIEKTGDVQAAGDNAEYTWAPLSYVKEIDIYPEGVKDLLINVQEGHKRQQEAEQAFAEQVNIMDLPDGEKMITGGLEHSEDFPPDPDHCPICKFMVEGDGSAEGLKEAFRKANEQEGQRSEEGES